MRAPRRPVRLLLHSQCRSASRERAKRGRPRPLSLGFIPTKLLSFLQSPAVAPTMLLSQDMHVRKRSPWPAIGLLVTLALARGEFAVPDRKSTRLSASEVGRPCAVVRLKEIQ